MLGKCSITELCPLPSNGSLPVELEPKAVTGSLSLSLLSTLLKSFSCRFLGYMYILRKQFVSCYTVGKFSLFSLSLKIYHNFLSPQFDSFPHFKISFSQNVRQLRLTLKTTVASKQG